MRRGEVVDERIADGLGRIATRVLDPDADLGATHAGVTALGRSSGGAEEQPALA